MVDRGSVDDLTINLRQQLMVNQFQTATGCSHDQAEQLLLSSRWQFQAYAPCNTPVTPPSLSETMMAFQQLHAIDDWMSRSPPSSVCFASSSHSSPMSGFTALTPTFIQSSVFRNIDRWTPAEFGSNLNMPNESSFSDGQSGTGAAKFAQFQ
ncbi:hypothetical protein Tsp_09078 [Trichinella spiralis]|uniref:hypothetical protein n=1 Tax=Trichinella spiralis TaxID=6334 RepID=UPI0001EFC95A|nr:hypothetical protein Tsp_09078 [Trichinella spiralis]